MSLERDLEPRSLDHLGPAIGGHVLSSPDRTMFLTEPTLGPRDPMRFSSSSSSGCSSHIKASCSPLSGHCRLGLYCTIPGLILVHSIYSIAVTTLIFRNYYTGIPDEMVDAARVDGAGILKSFRHVILPLSGPGFVVAAIFQFTGIWNDFLFGLVVTPDPRVQPIMVAVNNLSGSFSVDWNVVMAGAFIAALPTAVIYLLLSRYFVAGLTAGSMKG